MYLLKMLWKIYEKIRWAADSTTAIIGVKLNNNTDEMLQNVSRK